MNINTSCYVTKTIHHKNEIFYDRIRHNCFSVIKLAWFILGESHAEYNNNIKGKLTDVIRYSYKCYKNIHGVGWEGERLPDYTI